MLRDKQMYVCENTSYLVFRKNDTVDDKSSYYLFLFKLQITKYHVAFNLPQASHRCPQLIFLLEK